MESNGSPSLILVHNSQKKTDARFTRIVQISVKIFRLILHNLKEYPALTGLKTW